MKLKTTEVNGKQYAELDAKGLPVYVHDDGSELGFDAAQAKQKITELNSEAANNRKRYETAESGLKTFEGLDAEKARKALDIVQNLDDKKLVDAGEVEKMKTQLAETFKQTYDPQIAQLTQERDAATQQLHSELIGGGFARSKYIQEKVSVPVDMVQAMFGQSFKVENGKPVAYGTDGNKILSRTNLGEVAGFDEALEIMIGGYQHKDSILKGSQANGTGFQGNGGQGGGKTMLRSQFSNLSPAEQSSYMREGGKVTD